MPRRVRSPSWLDLRLVAGFGLVVVCVLIGVKIVSNADRTSRYWAADHDLAAGTVLQPDDLRSVAARLPSGASGYLRLDAGAAAYVGKSVNRAVNAGELLPTSALASTDPATTVTIPLGGDNAPKIAAGQRVTVWVSTKLCPSAMVLNDVTVQAVQSARAGALTGAGGADIVVRLTPDLAQRVVLALALTGGVVRAGIVEGSAQPPPALVDLSKCGTAGP